MDENTVIKKVELKPLFKFGGKVAQYEVNVVGDNGELESLFNFYTDEKHYNEHSFVGMTIKEAKEKFFNDDVAYLRR
ncbi:hypothetical protein D3C71_948650 [compost metagenome]